MSIDLASGKPSDGQATQRYSLGNSSPSCPSIVAELRRPRAFIIQYQLTEGRFMVNAMYYDLIESGMDRQLKSAPDDLGFL